MKSVTLTSLIFLALVLGALADDRVERLPSEERKWLEEEVVYIITELERDVFLELQTKEERDKLKEALWARRDDSPTTLVNEYRDEHYRRLEYANRVLGRDSPRPGWKTDRGKHYIILGEPLEIQRYDGLNDVVSIELWIYTGDTKLGLPPRFNLLFFKEEDIGEYKLYHPFADGPEELLRGAVFFRADQNRAVDKLEVISIDLARASLTVDLTESTAHMLAARNTIDPTELTVRPPLNVDRTFVNIAESATRRVSTDYLDGYLRHDDVSVDYSFNYVPNRSLFAVLAGPKETPFVHYSIELEPANFSLEVDEDETKYYTVLDSTVEVSEREGQVIAVIENQVAVELARSQFDKVKSFPFAYQSTFPLLPGDYEVTVILKNRATKQYTIARQELRVEPVAGPTLSDVVLGYQKEPGPSAESGNYRTFQMGNEEIQPAVDGVFAVGETVYVCLQPVGVGPEHTLRFSLLKGEEKLRERETRAEDYGGGPAIEAFSLLGVVGGFYEMQVELMDPAGAAVAKRSVPLQVSPRAVISRPGVVFRRGFDVGLLQLARGQQLLTMGRIEEAKAELEAVVAADPELPMARWKLAGALIYSGEADRILELLLPIEDDFPNEYEVVEGLGYAYYLRKDYAQASEYFDRARTLRRPDPPLLNALGDSYQQLGNVDKARETFERSLKLNPAQEGVKDRLSSLEKTSQQ